VAGKFVLSLSAEGGYIHSFNKPRSVGSDKVRLIDRFFLGEPDMRGFDIRGIGPRVIRYAYDETGNLVTDRKSVLADDSLGGRAYYNARIELEIPLGPSLKELGLRPSVFADAGALWALTAPPLSTLNRVCADAAGVSSFVSPGGPCPAGTSLVNNGFKEFYFGDTARPRISVGFGVNWNSPFGPFRIDIARALVKAQGDDTKLLTFNVGTAF
jgi:outer membrane protein insertion porin family